MLVEGGKPDANLARAIAMIADALAKGCDIVVLPECLNYGWTHPSARGAAPPIPGPHSDLLASAAGLWVVAGLVESDGGRLYNAAVMISPEGEIVLKHRKINELEIAHDLYSLGTSVGVAETPLGTLGLNICADNPQGRDIRRIVGLGRRNLGDGGQSPAVPLRLGRRRRP